MANGFLDPGKGQKGSNWIVWILLLIGLVLLVQLGSGAGRRNDPVQEITLDELYKAIDSGQIARLNIDSEHRVVTGSFQDKKLFRTTFADAASLEKKALEKGVKITAVIEKPDAFVSILASLLPWLLILFVSWFLFIRPIGKNGGTMGGINQFGKSRTKWVENIPFRFDDVQGCEEAKDEVKEVVDFLKHPEQYSKLGGRVPRGILLIGPAGTGKTLLAKAMAGEANVPFGYLSGSDFVEVFVGIGASRVRDMFQQAHAKSPSILFIDEIDAIGRKRSGAGHSGGHDEREQCLNEILTGMDGFNTDSDVIVIAATNRADILDSALMRPGRFDRKVEVPLPDVKGREAILMVHAKKVKAGASVDFKKLARMTPRRSGADLEAIVNEAAILAASKRVESVEHEHFAEAADKVMFGKSRKSAVVPEEDMNIAAFHEAGHTICLKKLASVTDPVHKVTIIPRGASGGATFWLPERDRSYMTKERAEAQLVVAMGGRAAEEIHFGPEKISSGAHSDFTQATELAKAMVTEWGMTVRIGARVISAQAGYIGAATELWDCGPDLRDKADREIERILNEAYLAAKKIIESNLAQFKAIALALREKETLTGEEVDQVIASVSEPKENDTRENLPPSV